MGKGLLANIAMTVIAVITLSGCGGNTNNSDVASYTPDSTGMEAPTDNVLNEALAAEFTRLGIDPQKVIAAAPQGDRNAVIDLQAAQHEPDATPESTGPCIRLSWTERLAGDYDQNGEVLVSDLSALGQNFGSSIDYLPADENDGIANLPSGALDSENMRMARVDGDGNGVINLGDLSVIAQHFQQRMDGYRIYRQSPGEESFTMLPHPIDPGLPYTVGRSEALGGGGQAVHFIFDDLVTIAGGYDYYVAGFDDGSDTEGSTSYARGGDGPGSGPGNNPIIEFSPPPAPNPLPEFEGTILIIRNDDDNYDSNYDAITSDLDDLSTTYEEIDYYDGVDDYFLAGSYDLAIWYRGGPGGSDTDLQESMWSEEEMSNLHGILDGDGSLLLMSQNHEMSDLFFINSWISHPEYSGAPAPTVPISNRWFVEMEGFCSDDGLGYGGTHGYFPTSTTSAIGLIESYTGEDETGTGRIDGEYFDGENSSGKVPWQIKLPEDSQFTARSFYGPIFNGTSAATGFRTGLDFLPYVIHDDDPPESEVVNEFMVSTYASWGSNGAPYENVGFYPNYNWDDNGISRYWVIGYAWNDVEIVQDPEELGTAMVRAELLLNAMAWLMN